MRPSLGPSREPSDGSSHGRSQIKHKMHWWQSSTGFYETNIYLYGLLPESLMHGKIGLKTHIIEIEPVILSAELPSLSSLVL